MRHRTRPASPASKRARENRAFGSSSRRASRARFVPRTAPPDQHVTDHTLGSFGSHVAEGNRGVLCMFRTGASWSGLRYDVRVAVTETLRTVLEAGGASRRLDELSTARVILKIAEQVHAAQQKAGAGKAIGPLTPSSITIETSTGAVKLGLAEPRAFAYAAPEQTDGGEGERRSDVSARGVVRWEALTHQPLFEGGDDTALKAAVKQQIVDPPATLNANIPAELSAICMRALARNPAARYQSAKVMGAELEAVLDDAGYGDTDDKLREYMATLGQPKREPKLAAPPMTVTPAKGIGIGEPPADMLTPPPGPPANPGANLAAALASAGTQPAPATAKPERVGFQTIHAAAAPMPASPITAAPTTIPMAPVLPKSAASATAQEIQKPVDVAHAPPLVASAAAASAASSASLASPPAATATAAASTTTAPAVKRDTPPAPRPRAPTKT